MKWCGSERQAMDFCGAEDCLHYCVRLKANFVEKGNIDIMNVKSLVG